MNDFSAAASFISFSSPIGIRCPQPVTKDAFTIIKDPQPLYQYQDYFIVSCKTGYNLMEVSLIHLSALLFLSLISFFLAMTLIQVVSLLLHLKAFLSFYISYSFSWKQIKMCVKA